MPDKHEKSHYQHLAYRSDIDGLRALAVLAVVVFHAFPERLKGGFVGVDIFFVISGFLISGIIFKSLSSGSFSFREFYARRVKRIFPALFVVLSACFILGWFLLLSDELTQLGLHMAAGAGFVQNFVLWGEAGYFNNASETKPLMHLWSLGIEEQYYFIYPALVWLAWRFKANLFWLVALSAAASFALNLFQVGSDPVATFFLPHTRFWELLAGGLLAYFVTVKKEEKKKFAWLQRFSSHSTLAISFEGAKVGASLRHIVSVSGLLLILAAFFLVDRMQEFPGWRAALPVAGAFLLILAGPLALVNRRILSHPVMVFVGLISYPLYLWHWPLLSMARIIQGDAPSKYIRLAIVVLSVVLAWLTYRMIEKPFRLGRKTWVKPASLCLLMLVVGSVGLRSYLHDGYPHRFPDLEREYKATFDWGDRKENANCRETYKDFEGAYCSLHHKGEPQIALVGDSHSMALNYGLAEAFASRGMNLVNLAVASCQPFYDATYLSDGQKVAPPKTNACTTQMNDALARVEKMRSVETIILSSNSASDILEQVSSNGSGFTPEFADDFEKTMRTTLMRLLATGRKVVFVVDVPLLTFYPKSCIKHHPVHLSAWVNESCSISRTSFEDLKRSYRKLVFSVLKDFPRVLVFDSASYVCDENICSAKKDGKLLFMDGDHLSIFGSQYLGAKLAEKILDH